MRASDVVEPALRLTVGFLLRFFFVVSVYATCSLGVRAEGPVDFSGTWKMDAARSESAHQVTPIGPVTVVVKQSDNDLSIEIRSRDPHSSTIHSEILTYKLDGTETTTTATDGTPIKSKAHWEGTKLIAETTRNIQKFPVSMLYIYSLDAKGKEITIFKTLSLHHGYQTQEAKSTSSGTDVFIKTRFSDSE